MLNLMQQGRHEAEAVFGGATAVALVRRQMISDRRRMFSC
jgi:hypothetical protein